MMYNMNRRKRDGAEYVYRGVTRCDNMYRGETPCATSIAE